MLNWFAGGVILGNQADDNAADGAGEYRDPDPADQTEHRDQDVGKHDE